MYKRQEVGSEVAFEALLTSDGKKVAVGDPILKDVAVKGKVLAQDKAKKVIVFKYKPKKDYRKKQGHRQPYTKVEITQVGSEVAPAKEKPAKAAKVETAEKLSLIHISIPKPFQGFPIALITASLMSVAFMGFSGLV